MKSENIQGYLSLGYLFLLVVGLLKDVIYFGILGLNILHYANFLDVLISPISFLAEDKIVSIAILSLGLLFYGVYRFKLKYEPKYKDKPWFEKLFGDSKKTLTKEQVTLSTTAFIAIAIIMFYLGGSVGKGFTISSKIEKSELKMNDKITFLDKEMIKTSIVGQTSEFIFYVKEGSQDISITPIKGVIREIIESKD